MLHIVLLLYNMSSRVLIYGGGNLQNFYMQWVYKPRSQADPSPIGRLSVQLETDRPGNEAMSSLAHAWP